MQCGAQPDEASNTLTRRPATHNRPLIHAHGFNADASQFFPGIERDIARQLPGSCPDAARTFQRINRRIDADNVTGCPADNTADGRRECGVIAAGNPPENRRIQKPSLSKGFGFPCSIAIILRQFAIKSGTPFCAMIAQNPALFRIESSTTMSRRSEV